jgi:hypothetical protein
MNPSPKNDFTGYNEAHALVETGIKNCNECSGNPKEERAGWLLAALPRAEKVLKRYGLDDDWCSRRKKPKLREIVKSYILDDLKLEEVVLRKMAPQLWEPFSLDAVATKSEEQAPAPEALAPARTYLVRSEKGLAMAGLVDFKIELPGGAPMTAKDWTMVDVMTEAALKWIKNVKPDSISFSDDDVWRLTGLKGWHVNQIKEVFLRVLDLKIVAPCKTEYDEEKRTWTQTTYYGHVFNADRVVAYGKLLGRKGRVVDDRSVKHMYHFFPDERYAHLLVNLALGKALRLDQKLYRLSDEAQIIYRRFSLFKYDPKGSFFTYEQMAALLGWSLEGTKQLCAYRLKRMKTFLEELKTAGLLRWQVKNPKKRGRETVFHLWEPEKKLKA